ncbi:MAG: glycerol kinase GlpK [Gemmatimonadota bacterium]|jgi:glycerol kinase
MPLHVALPTLVESRVDPVYSAGDIPDSEDQDSHSPIGGHRSPPTLLNPHVVLAIDQGTTSSRAIVFDAAGRPLGSAQRELPQIFPRSGWVEHDPERIWRDTLAVGREAISASATDPSQVAAIGVTNQRETSVIWSRADGRPIHNAIVWQDRRTAGECRRLRNEGHEDGVRRTTGLLLDPYFSATKLAWILDHVEGARAAAERDELAAGTIDTWLLWNLTDGRVHATDATNASRTLLFDIHEQAWDPDLLALFRVPEMILPEVRDSSGSFGEASSELFGAPIPIRGIAGDQQAATFGQAAFTPGMIKSTFGTGTFALLNTGPEPIESRNRLLSTVAWRLDGVATYALEGSIFVGGAAVQWLRDGLGVIDEAAETEALAEGVEDTGGVYLVPAFVGLGAPYWDPDARGAILGITRSTGVAHIARAALEAVCYQTRDLMGAMAADSGADLLSLRVDGGLVANDWAMQFLSDILALPVERPKLTETTALGAAYLAGLDAGVFGGLDEIEDLWQRERRFEPTMKADRREALFAGWKRAVTRVLSEESTGRERE